MANPHVLGRLEGILNVLRASYAAGASLSAATKGSEREDFVHNALATVVAPPFRIGNGDITDASGIRSGQVDIVIEYNTSLSFPLSASAGAARLYLAEGVCAVVEVKSDLIGQWDEIRKTSATLAPLRRAFGASMSFGADPGPSIPLFAIGYRGWKNRHIAEKKLREAGLAGVLIIETGLYVSQNGTAATGGASLLVFFSDIARLMTSVLSFHPNYLAYGLPPVPSAP